MPTTNGLLSLRRILVALALLLMFAVGFWMLNQVLDSVGILGRSVVDVPGYPRPVDAWLYHDVAYALIWAAYSGFVIWGSIPWRTGRLTAGMIIIALLGFSSLTAGLWISQDLMNAVLILHRGYVDLPFFVTSLDLYQTRDLAVLLVSLSFIGLSLVRAGRSE